MATDFVMEEAPVATKYSLSETGIVYDPLMMRHENPIRFHPEQPLRISRIYDLVSECFTILSHNEPRDVYTKKVILKFPLITFGNEILKSVHDPDYLKKLEEYKDQSDESLHSASMSYNSIYMNQFSVSCAYLSADYVMTMAKAIADGHVRNGFAVVRPPGHHAESHCAMGFCFLNNVAITARMLQKEYNMNRILIVDWDVHHGNATQNMFYDDPSVLYFSIHRYDDGEFYPNSTLANVDKIGGAKARGRNVNVPWPDGGFGDYDYLHIFNRILLPMANEFQPDFVIVSCGFDAAEGDPVGGCCVSPSGYAHMTHLLKSISNGRLLLALEGGYNLDSISNSALACVKVLTGESPPAIPFEAPNVETFEVAESVVKYHSAYWRSLYPKFPVPISDKMSQFGEGVSFPLRVAINGLCTKQLEEYELNPLPLTDIALEELFKDRLHVTSDILESVDTLVVFLHNQVDIRSEEGTFQLSDIDSSVTMYLPWLKHIKHFRKKGYSILSASISYSKPIAQEWTILERENFDWQVDKVHMLLEHIWTCILSHTKARKIVIVADSDLSQNVIHLINTQSVETKLKGVVLVRDNDKKVKIASNKQEWFENNAIVLSPGMFNLGEGFRNEMTLVSLGLYKETIKAIEEILNKET